MVVDDLNVVRIAFPKLEANPPALIHGHRPLTSSSTFELVQPGALEWTQVLKRGSDIQRQKQIDRGIEVESAELVRVLTFPDLAGRRVAP